MTDEERRTKTALASGFVWGVQKWMHTILDSFEIPKDQRERSLVHGDAIDRVYYVAARGDEPISKDYLLNVPDYPKSLDAMHGAEETMTQEQREFYVDTLSISCGNYEEDGHKYGNHAEALFATARQRNTAFLMTLLP